MFGRCVFAISLVLAAGVARAQEDTTGSITGQVIDAQGVAVAGAVLTLVTPQGLRVFTTDSDGRFVAPFIAPDQPQTPRQVRFGMRYQF